MFRCESKANKLKELYDAYYNLVLFQTDSRGEGLRKLNKRT